MIENELFILSINYVVQVGLHGISPVYLSRVLCLSVKLCDGMKNSTAQEYSSLTNIVL